MNNNLLNAVVKDALRRSNVLTPDDYLLVAAPSDSEKGRRYVWNIHVHGKPRKIIEPNFLLVALDSRPSSPNQVVLRHIFRIPVAGAPLSICWFGYDSRHALDTKRVDGVNKERLGEDLLGGQLVKIGSLQQGLF